MQALTEAIRNTGSVGYKSTSKGFVEETGKTESILLMVLIDKGLKNFAFVITDAGIVSFLKGRVYLNQLVGNTSSENRNKNKKKGGSKPSGSSN